MKTKTFFDFAAKDANDNTIDLAHYKNKIILVVNVASQCGFTPQYTGLEALYQKYKSKDFVVLAFPCNQFGNQEPGTNADIQTFCELNYKVTFPVFSKINVNGKTADPLYTFLKENARGFLGTKNIKWNFTKFLIGKDGAVLKRYAPSVKPEELAQAIEKELKN